MRLLCNITNHAEEGAVCYLEVTTENKAVHGGAAGEEGGVVGSGVSSLNHLKV